MTAALVVGGTGAVGRAVVAELTRVGAETVLTYHRRAAEGEALAREHGQRARALDASRSNDVAALVAELAEEGFEPDTLIHCAARLDPTPVLELGDAAFDAAYALNARSAFVAAREVARGMARRATGSIVLVGGLDRAQSLPIPVAYAACQGMLAATTMAMAKELGPAGVRINMVTLGLLDDGLSLGLEPKIRQDYLAYSALRRFGTPDEAARAIVWLALHDVYLNGKVIPINGGI